MIQIVKARKRNLFGTSSSMTFEKGQRFLWMNDRVIIPGQLQEDEEAVAHCETVHRAPAV